MRARVVLLASMLSACSVRAVPHAARPDAARPDAATRDADSCVPRAPPPLDPSPCPDDPCAAGFVCYQPIGIIERPPRCGRPCRTDCDCAGEGVCRNAGGKVTFLACGGS